MDNIEDIIEDILSQKDSKEVYTTKYKEFSEKYPTLFEKLFEPNFDRAVLRYMLNQKGKMSSIRSSSTVSLIPFCPKNGCACSKPLNVPLPDSEK